ncbi:MAG: MaoC family dehydratase [Acidobacteria bacterium]|nr:MaoC family dehydratase [Acidobacteriota bacterium]
MRVVNGLGELEQLVGSELGTSGWLRITQEMVNTFSDVTGDPQWIHLDVERAARELPGGRPIVQGFFTLSLVVRFRNEILDLRGVTRTINYGLNRVRFISPVAVGMRVRGRETLVSAERVAPDALRLISKCVVSAEGVDKPACVAEFVTLVYE